MAYTEETIVIKDPSQKLISLIDRMRDFKRVRREQTRLQEPIFNVQVS